MRTVTQGIYCYSLITVLLWEYLPTCEKVHNSNFIVRTESIRFSYFQRIAQSESAFKSIFSAIIKLKNILHMSENVFILIDRQLNANDGKNWAPHTSTSWLSTSQHCFRSVCHIIVQYNILYSMVTCDQFTGWDIFDSINPNSGNVRQTSACTIFEWRIFLFPIFIHSVQ